MFGWEENDDGRLVKQKNTDVVFAGEKHDAVGPGQYEVPIKGRQKGATKWHEPV